jgi:hypothetical protein
MRCEITRSAGRLACLFLAFLLAFLSYRPAISILSIAGTAKNPTDGRSAGGSPEIDSRENLPRPAKNKQSEIRERLVQKIQKSRSVTEAEQTLLEVLQLGPGYDRKPPARSQKVDGDIAKPDYLRLFLPANPGGPQSPPA